MSAVVAPADLLEVLRELETELHRPEIRRDAVRLAELLHPDFLEFGRSGRAYSREEILAEFADVSDFPTVVASDFRLEQLGGNIALLTYRSAHAGSSGKLHRFSLRSSLWVREGGRWRMRFHQGTPVDGEA